MKLIFTCILSLLNFFLIAYPIDENFKDSSSTCEYNQIKVVSSHCQEMIQFIKEFPYQNYHIQAVKCLGYIGHFYIDAINDTIKNVLNKGEAWEQHIAQLIAKYARPGSKVLDIGAHIGTHSLTMAKCVGPNGSVLAFEPQPKIFRELFLNVSINPFNNIQCYWTAVGAENGSIEIPNFYPNSEGSTPLISTEITKNLWENKILRGTGIFADLTTIDSLNLNDVSLIKIDVEGMENAVIDGAKETILRNNPVIILEIMGGWVPETAPSDILKQIEFSKQKMRNLGYNITRISNWDYLLIPK